MKTIIITSFHSLISRNILASGFLEKLLEIKNIKVLILYPDHKKAFFEKEFSNSNAKLIPIKIKVGKRDNFLRYLSLSALRTKTLDIKRKTELNGSGSISSFVLDNPFSHIILRAVSKILTPREPFEKIIDEHSPDIIFSTDILNEYDVRLMQAGRDKKIKIISMVRSWDNLTSKGLIRIIPDVLFVNNEVLKKEAITIQGVSKNIINIVGVPHYDDYFNEKRNNREDFFRKINGDTTKKILLFVPTGDRYLEKNTVDSEVLDILDKNLPSYFQILVRLPPSDRVRELEKLKSSNRIIFDMPSDFFGKLKETELGKDEDIHLADTLFYSDIVVSGPSTMCIDSAVFDKPIILVGFDGYEKRPYYKSIKRFYDYNHFDEIFRSGGVAYAQSIDEFISMIKDYIENPLKDKEGRIKLVEKECFRFDGKSSERLLDKLVGEIDLS